MHKFFVGKKNIDGGNILITGEDVLHITKVLRLRNGENIQVSDCNGKEYICTISEAGKKEVKVKIVEEFENVTEAPVEIILYQGIPKGQKMDLIVQKSVEIGVHRIQPVITERVVVKTGDKENDGKLERWRRISEEASKQSNRGIIPYVANPIGFAEAICELKKMDLAVMPYEGERGRGLKEVLKKTYDINSVGIFIGPEGGFELSEVDQCFENNIYPVTLGPRILRTETAGFVTASIVLYEIGDLGGNK